MKIRMVAIALLIFCLSSVAYSQQTKLEGYVSDDHERRVSGVRIIAPGGEEKETDSQGHFVIAFPSSVKPGQAMHIKVDKMN